MSDLFQENSGLQQFWSVKYKEEKLKWLVSFF